MTEISTDDIKEIEKLETEATITDETKRQAIQSARAKVNVLRERILGGETTGDPVKDFVIVRYNMLSSEIEEIYRDLQERVTAHNGEFVLMVVKTEECNVHGSPGFIPSDDNYYVKESIHLGVLNGTGLILDPTSRCELPTSKAVHCRDIFGQQMTQSEGNITTSWETDIGIHLNQPLVPRNPMYAMMRNTSHFRLEIKIGDEEVRAWFESGHSSSMELFEKAGGEMLGRPEEARSSEEIADRQALRERTAQDLGELIDKANRLTRELKESFELIFAPDNLLRRESLPVRRELDGVEERITDRLKAAISLGMNNDNYPPVQTLIKEYLPDHS